MLSWKNELAPKRQRRNASAETSAPKRQRRNASAETSAPKRQRRNAWFPRYSTIGIFTGSGIRKMIFASENNGFRWHESDCADEGVQTKLFNSLLKNPHSLYHFHFVALNMLLRGFTELRHFFCYAKNRIDTLIIKERICYHFGEALLNSLEMTYPLIMQFDVANVTHILGLFVEQLSHKTGSFQAEMVEARVYAPALLQEMNLYAENAHDDGFTAKKVEMAKEFFYQLLIETQMPGIEESEHSIRDAFCVLYHFFECMMEEKQLIVKVMMAHCEREENVKMAIAIQRDRMRGSTIQFVMNSLASPELMMVKRIRRTKGGRTRLWKLLYNYDQKIEQNEQEMANLWETLELSDDIIIDYEDNQQLISHYENVLLSDGRNEFVKMEGKMKAEIFLIISWINAQFPPTKPFSAKVLKNVQIYLPLSVKMLDSFYDRLFDYQKIEELERDEQELVDLIMAIRGQIEQIVVGHQRTKSETELIKEWRRRNFAGVKRSKKAQQIAKAKHWAEYGPWMRQMHGQTLIKLIKTDEQFAQKLKNGKEEENTEEISENFDEQKGGMEEKEEKTTENLEEKKEIGENEENIKEKFEKEGKTKEKEETTEEKEETTEEKEEKIKKNLENGEKIEEKIKEKEVKTKENFEREEKFEESEEKSAENLEKVKLEEKVSKQKDFESANGTKLKKNDGQIAKSANSSPEKLDINEFAFIELGDFEDDQFLALKYGEFLGILSRNDGEKARKIWFSTLEKIEEKENLAKCAAIEHSLAHLLDIGILANEIWHYVQTIKALNGKSKDLAKFEKEWAQLKQLKLEEEISSKKWKQTLFSLLKRIVMEGIAAKNVQNLKLEMNGEIGQCADAIIQFAKLVLGNEKLEPICILSDQFDRNLIVDELNCEMYEKEKCTDSSLYCIICKHSAVKSLINANLSALPKLEFLFMDVPIEMKFIFVPKDKLSTPNEQINLSNYEKLANNFAENIEKLAFNDNFDDKMNKDEIDLLEDFLEKPTFRNQFEMDNVLEDKKQLETTKEKALKDRQNLEEQKAMLMTLSIQITHQKNADFLVWSPGREWFTKKQFGSGKIPETMAMPIISPLFPEQNEAYRINLSTAKVIQNELKLAFLQIRNMNETRQIIEPILGKKKFTEKYEHFVTFVCAGTEWNVEKFCQFVGKRLGHELLHFVEQSSANLINVCHIYPKLVHVEQQLSEDKKWKNLQKRIWLVGLKLQKQKKRNDEALTSELKAVLSSKLAEIDAKIKSDFEGKRYYNVRLNSEFVERSELENLGNF
ncbi:hypothetical protein niasHT_011460 [Heterodera trifolii]|uniref:Uncharacterized protein n=1 Tax=Heterodera trifolii TaxID=157864 RepID=A0ABD2L292_9BILA